MTDWQRRPESWWAERLLAAGVAAELAARLGTLAVLVGRYQGAVNLVGRVDEEELLQHHLLESLAGAVWLTGRGRLLDVGSGNGFPALVLLAAAEGWSGVLLEPRERRWAYLREAVRVLALDAEVRAERVEVHAGRDYDALSVRALAASAWAAPAARLLRPGGLVLRWGREEEAPGSGFSPVLRSPLPDARRGLLVVWRRCFT